MVVGRAGRRMRRACTGTPAQCEQTGWEAHLREDEVGGARGIEHEVQLDALQPLLLLLLRGSVGQPDRDGGVHVPGPCHLPRGQRRGDAAAAAASRTAPRHPEQRNFDCRWTIVLVVIVVEASGAVGGCCPEHAIEGAEGRRRGGGGVARAARVARSGGGSSGGGPRAVKWTPPRHG